MGRIDEAKGILKKESNPAIGWAALGVSIFDLERVIAEYRTFFESQSLKFTKTSVEELKDQLIHIMVLWQIFQDYRDDDNLLTFLKDIFPQLVDYQINLYKHYCPSEYGLVVIDDLIDPCLNSLFACSNESIIELGYALELTSEDLFEQNELTLHSMNDLLWDEKAGLYNGYSLNTKSLMVHQSSSGFLPLIAGVPDINQVLIMVHRAFGDDFRQSGFYSFPSSSLSTGDIQYTIPNAGAISIIDNWLLIQGLRRYDMDDLSDVILEDTLVLLERHGFYAHFDPRKSSSSNAVGDPSNLFSAAIFAYLLREDL